MESDSSISRPSPPPPSAQEYCAASEENTPETEEYETASDPEVDESDSAALTEETFLPAENTAASSPAIEDQNNVPEDESEVHDPSKKRVFGESSDSVGVSEKKEVQEKLSSLTLDQIGSDESGVGEVSKSVENGVGESGVEKYENSVGEIEKVNKFVTGGSQEIEPNEEGKDDYNDTPRSIEASESGVSDSATSMNQNALKEVEPKGVEAESIVVATAEVGVDAQQRFDAVVEEEEKSVKPVEALPADGDVLEHNHSVTVQPKVLEVEAEPIADRAEKVEPFVNDVNATESTGAGDEPEAVVETDKKSVKQDAVGAIDEVNSERSIGTCNLLNAEASELNSIDSNDEVAIVEKGEDLVESPIIVEPGPVKITVDKLHQVNYGEISGRGASLNQQVADKKVVVGSEHVSSNGEGELLTADDGDLNPSVEVETLPVTAKEAVVGDESTHETTIESLPQKGTSDKLEKLDYSEISERSTLNQEIADNKAVIGSEHASSLDEGKIERHLTVDDGELSPVEAEILPVTANETVVVDENTPETITESQPQVPELNQKVDPDAVESKVGAVEDEKDVEKEDEDSRMPDGPARVAILDSPEAAKQMIREMDRISSNSQSGLQGSRDYSNNADGQIVSDSDEGLDSDEDGDGEELFDSAALAQLLKAATGSSDGTVTVTSQDAARIFSVDRPAGLGMSGPPLRPAAPRSTRPSLFASSELASVSEPAHSMDDDEKKLHEKVEQIRVKFLRLVHRLGHSPEDTVAAQVLYRLSLAEGIRQGRQMSPAFSIESAKKQALQIEKKGKDDLDFSCNILVVGKTGVGKSATINSIFGEERSHTNPFQLTTTSVREISGVVDGVRIRVVDTPGLKASIMDQAANKKILSSIKKFTKKCPPDIVLYVDRMDTQTRDFNDLPMLRSITSILGSSIWFNAIVALTHAASAPPDGPNGTPLGYEVFVAQRSHVVQQSIRQAAGDMRLMNPVALVENHPSCRRNREGERVLPNGLSWRPQLLLLSYSSKILSEANSLLKLQDPSPGKLFGFRLRSPPLPFLLSSLLQSRAHPKLSGDQGGDNADSDIDLNDLSDAEQDEEEDEYDRLPPFKPLRKSQIAKLSKEQRKAYFDEYDYRVKLLQKKQWKEELQRLKEIKKKGKDNTDRFANGDMPEDYDQDGSPAAVQVPLPDMVLPPSFDCDNPAYRYRFLEPTSQLLTRPVLDTHGWDHDCGYDGVSIEENLAIVGQFPTSMAIQITKDKKEFNIHVDSSVAAKHGEHGSTLAGFDIQSVGKQLAYILRGETKFKNLKKNKTAAGISVTFLGETIATGLKVEDRISIGKRLGLVASTGAVRAQGDVAFGANLEARLRDKDYPFGQALSTLGLSLMKWRSDLALGANLQSQFSVGRNAKMSVRVGLNNKLTGQITVRTSTSEQLQIAFLGIIPLAISIYRSIRSNESY